MISLESAIGVFLAVTGDLAPFVILIMNGIILTNKVNITLNNKNAKATILLCIFSDARAIILDIKGEHMDFEFSIMRVLQYS